MTQSGPRVQLKLKWEKRRNHIFGSPFLEVGTVGCVRERNKRKSPPSLYDLCRSGGRNLSSQDLKFIYSTRATCGVPTTRNFVEDFVFGEEKLEREALTFL